MFDFERKEGLSERSNVSEAQVNETVVMFLRSRYSPLSRREFRKIWRAAKAACRTRIEQNVATQDES